MFNVGSANISWNNLGGVGPDTGEQSIRYQRIGELNGLKFDMLLTNVSKYHAPNGASVNGNNGEFGILNIAYGSHVRVKYQMVVSGTDEPMVSPPARTWCPL